MLLQRVVSAAVGIPIILFLVLVGGLWFSLAVAIVLAIATAEFHSHAALYRRPLAMLSAALSALLGVAPAFTNAYILWPFLLTLAVLLLLTWTVVFATPESGLTLWMFSLASVTYIGWLGSHFTALRHGPDGRDWVLVAILTTWITDTAAYFVGKALGRRKLAPHISPGKTVEGAIAGFLFGALAVVLLYRLFALEGSHTLMAALALLVPSMAQLGDLGESLVKRGLQVKDSSRLIPGHGGFLDRLDSLLFATVTVYYLIRL